MKMDRNKEMTMEFLSFRNHWILIATLLTAPAIGSFAKNNDNNGHAQVQNVQQINLVSDQPGVALLQDTNLVNAWGVSFAPTGPFWISDNGTGLSTLYDV